MMPTNWSAVDISLLSNLSFATLDPLEGEDKSESYRIFKIVIDIYFVGMLCIFGILGNVISIVVLGKDRTMRRTTAFLLQMVALADSLYLITCLLIQTLNTINEFQSTWVPSLRLYWPYMAQYVWAFASIAQTCTVWLVLILTADRYVAICKPLHAPQYSTMYRMTRVVFVVWVTALVYNIPRFFERTILMKYDNDTGTEYPKDVKSEFRQNIYYFVIYKCGCYFLLRVLIPLSLLAFFNTRLIQAIKDSHRLARIYSGSRGLTSSQHNSSSRRERPLDRPAPPRTEKNRHNLTLVVVVLVFVLCTTPDMLLRIYASAMYIVDRPIPAVARYINTISNLLLTINSCVNFVIYCFLGQKFRSILVHMVCKKAASQANHELSLYSQNGKSAVIKSGDFTDEMAVLMNNHSH